MSRARTAALVTAAALAFLPIASDGQDKQTQGTIGGAVVGGVVGSFFGKGSGRVVAIGGGAVVGGFIGNRVGKRMDDKDKREAQAAAKKAETAPVGEKIAWSNPDSGNSGTIEVVKEGKDTDGNMCRDLKHTVEADGETETDTGVICKNAKGKWVTVEYDE